VLLLLLTLRCMSDPAQDKAAAAAAGRAGGGQLVRRCVGLVV